jgi:hypothetical protein
MGTKLSEDPVIIYLIKMGTYAFGVSRETISSRGQTTNVWDKEIVDVTCNLGVTGCPD